MRASRRCKQEMQACDCHVPQCKIARGRQAQRVKAIVTRELACAGNRGGLRTRATPPGPHADTHTIKVLGGGRAGEPHWSISCCHHTHPSCSLCGACGQRGDLMHGPSACVAKLNTKQPSKHRRFATKRTGRCFCVRLANATRATEVVRLAIVTDRYALRGADVRGADYQ